MSEIKEFKEQYEKTEAAWPISVQRIEKEIKTGIWVTTQWELKGFELSPEDDAQDEEADAAAPSERCFHTGPQNCHVSRCIIVF